MLETHQELNNITSIAFLDRDRTQLFLSFIVKKHKSNTSQNLLGHEASMEADSTTHGMFMYKAFDQWMSDFVLTFMDIYGSCTV